jgi:hypothetical protein
LLPLTFLAPPSDVGANGVRPFPLPMRGTWGNLITRTGAYGTSHTTSHRETPLLFARQVPATTGTLKWSALSRVDAPLRRGRVPRCETARRQFRGGPELPSLPATLPSLHKLRPFPIRTSTSSIALPNLQKWQTQHSERGHEAPSKRVRPPPCLIRG